MNLLHASYNQGFKYYAFRGMAGFKEALPTTGTVTAEQLV